MNRPTLYATLLQTFFKFEVLKLYILAAVAILVFTSCNNKQSEKHSLPDSSQLLSLEHKWLEAEFSLDTSFLSAIIDSTFISISEEGVKKKNEDLLSMYNNIKQRQLDSIFIDSFKLENAVVKIYETTAVVTFIVHTFGKNKNTPRERLTRFYDVWVKRSDGWKAISSQGTPLEQTK
jgi:hypothetical protein